MAQRGHHGGSGLLRYRGGRDTPRAAAHQSLECGPRSVNSEPLPSLNTILIRSMREQLERAGRPLVCFLCFGNPCLSLLQQTRITIALIPC